LKIDDGRQIVQAKSDKQWTIYHYFSDLTLFVDKKCCWTFFNGHFIQVRQIGFFLQSLFH